MMLKKLAIIMLVVLMSITVLACGKSSDQQNTTASSTTTSKTTSSSTVPIKSTTSSGPSFDDATPTTTQNTTQITLETGTKIPDGYPNDVLAIYAGSNIISAMGDGSSYVIVAYSADSMDMVIDFYKNVLKDAQVTFETVLETSFTSFGTLQGYTYTLDVGSDDQYKDYKTSISITIYK